MLKKLLLTLTVAASFAFAGPCCKGDMNNTRACDTNVSVAACKLGKNCPCGPECKCGDNCKCKPMKKSKKACDGNMSGRPCDINKTK